MLSKILFGLFILNLVIGSIWSSAFADEATNLTLKAAEKSLLKEDGWHFKLDLSGTVSLGSSDKVIGQQDGSSTTLGTDIVGAANYRKESHEVRNNLSIKEATSRTPAVPSYVKSADELKYDLTYLYSLESYPRIGPYAKASATAPLFKGESKTPTAETYSVNGSQVTTDTLRLTDGLRPLETRQSVGFFAKAIDREKTKLEFRLGYGARQIKAKGNFAIQDDTATANLIEVVELTDFNQSGIEGGFDFNGRWDDKSSYGLTGEFLTPVTKSLPPGAPNKSNAELTYMAFTAKLNTKLYDWAIVEYQFKTLNDPQLLDKWQTQQNLVLKFTYNLL